MLGNEHGVTTHRRLPPVLDRMCWRKPFSNEVAGMDEHSLKPPILQVLPLFLPKSEAAPERRSGQT